MAKSFRKFIEDSEKHPTISSLEDMLGIDPEDLKNEPQLASFFRIDQGTNLGSYRIVQFKRDAVGKITHALIEPMSMDKVYKYKDGSPNRIPDEKADKKMKLVPIEDLDGLLAQDFTTQQTGM